LFGLLLLAMGCGPDTETSSQQSSDKQQTPSPFQFDLSEEDEKSEQPRPSRQVQAARFTDVHEELGIRHVFFNGEKGRSYLHETTGGGAGWLDYDGDGEWDLYLNQGGDATLGPGPHQPSDVFYRNLGGGRFEEVATQAGIEEREFGQGVAVGDFDEDGFDDVYVTNVGRNSLWKNQGDGTFLEVSEPAGVDDPRWSSSAAWADIDLDGDLDLFVCNYLVDDPQDPRVCRNDKGEPRVCHPRDIDPWPNELFVNEADGTFSAQAAQRNLQGEGSKSLGVAIADFSNDGWPDIYVTNDTTANFYFINQHDGHFLDQAVLLGTAMTRYGSFQASMGLAIADYDQNGWLDIYATAFYEESNTLYQNLGERGFRDVTGLIGLHAHTMLVLTFGTHMADFNRDGYQELFLANGHIENFPGNPLYKMKPQLLSEDGETWVDCSAVAGPYFSKKLVGRAVAACDYDHDGDVDLAVANENDPAAILRNETTQGHWLKFQFRGRSVNRRGIGCRVTVVAGDATHMQELCGGTSYAAAHQPVLHFGLADWDQPCTVTVRWPDGKTQILDDVMPDQMLVLDEPGKSSR
jgi:hypothetical protein